MTEHGSIKPATLLGGLKGRIELAAAASAAHADKVDRDACFPSEAFKVLREQRLLGFHVPAAFGGEGASVGDIVDACYTLGQACASTAMIFAMHQIMAVILARHTRGSPWHEDLMRRLVAEQLLIASSTTEGQGGGDLRASSCAVERNGARMALTKSATVMSFGAESDLIFATARRAPDAQPTDQVLAALSKNEYVLEPLADWDSLGMRGTRSGGFTLRAAGAAEQVFPQPYTKIHAKSMMPVAHLTWSAVWCGIAANAVARVRGYVRKASRRAGGAVPASAARLVDAMMTLRALRALISSQLRRYEAAVTGKEEFDTVDFQTAMNLLKVRASEMAIQTVMTSMQAVGLSGYRNSGEFSLSRHMRDVLSSSIMINNDRIIESALPAAMLMEVPKLLRD